VTNNQFNFANNSQPALAPEEIGIYDSFLIKFLDIDFFTKLFNVTLYHTDFAIPFTSLKESDIIKFMKEFLNNVNTELKSSPKLPLSINQRSYFAYTQLLRQLLNSKEDSTSRLINYDNIEKHFNLSDISLTNIINKVKSEKLTTLDEFKVVLEEVLTTIESYNQLKLIRKSIQSLDDLRVASLNTNTPVLNMIKDYKDVVLEAYSGLSSLKILDKHDSSTDNLIFNNPGSVSTVIEHIREFFSTKYSIYKTGYELLDSQLSGIESSTITIIAGPLIFKGDIKFREFGETPYGTIPSQASVINR
jgi:hypothetical protein